MIRVHLCAVETVSITKFSKYCCGLALPPRCISHDLQCPLLIVFLNGVSSDAGMTCGKRMLQEYNALSITFFSCYI